MNRTSTNSYVLDSRLRDLPTYEDQELKSGLLTLGDGTKRAVRKLGNLTIAAKDWALAHKKEILTAVSILGSAVSILGLYFAAIGLTSGAFMTVVETTTWSWWRSIGNNITVRKAISLNPFFSKGIVLTFAGLFVSEQAKNAQDKVARL